MKLSPLSQIELLSFLPAILEKMDKSIRQCGELSHKDAKLSEASMDYFANKMLEYKNGRKEIEDLFRKIANLPTGDL